MVHTRTDEGAGSLVLRIRQLWVSRYVVESLHFALNLYHVCSYFTNCYRHSIGLFLDVSSAYNDPIFESLLNRWDLAESPGYVSEDNAENFNVYDLIPPDST